MCSAWECSQRCGGSAAAFKKASGPRSRLARGSIARQCRHLCRDSTAKPRGTDGWSGGVRARPLLQENNARARQSGKYYRMRFFARHPFPEPKIILSTTRETPRRENPERGSRPGFLSCRSYLGRLLINWGGALLAQCPLFPTATMQQTCPTGPSWHAGSFATMPPSLSARFSSVANTHLAPRLR